MFSDHLEDRPKLGRIKLIEKDFFTLVLHSNGSIQPMSYCAAVQTLKDFGFEPEERGKNQNGQHYETWRIPTERESGIN